MTGWHNIFVYTMIKLSCKNSLWNVGYYLGHFRNGLPNWSSALGKPCIYTKLILKTHLHCIWSNLGLLWWRFKHWLQYPPPCINEPVVNLKYWEICLKWQLFLFFFGRIWMLKNIYWALLFKVSEYLMTWKWLEFAIK